MLKEYAETGDVFVPSLNTSLSLAAVRTALLAVVLRTDSCLRDRVVDAARRGVDEICDAFSHADNTVSLSKPILWPTTQLRAAVYALFESLDAAEAAEARETRRLVEDLRGVVYDVVDERVA